MSCFRAGSNANRSRRVNHPSRAVPSYEDNGNGSDDDVPSRSRAARAGARSDKRERMDAISLSFYDAQLRRRCRSMSAQVQLRKFSRAALCGLLLAHRLMAALHRATPKQNHLPKLLSRSSSSSSNGCDADTFTACGCRSAKWKARSRASSESYAFSDSTNSSCRR